MLFNSYLFLFLFLPLALLGYFLLNRLGRFQLAEAFLIGMSLWFYGYFNPSYLLIICISILANYALSRLLSRRGESAAGRLLLSLGVAANLGAIFYFKYYDFFVSTVNGVFGTGFQLRHILLPLGISFFTFQQISYLVDSYRGETGDYGFLEYALFVSFFPQLVAGPIVLHSEMIPQFRDKSLRRFDWNRFGHGLYLFALGLSKKVLLADVLGKAVDWGFGGLGTLYSMSALDAVLVSLCYTFQLYFDFSGYCDMAMGLARMFNLRLPQNFNSPYKALSMVDFWNRWHMSLTRFLRNYIYFPLGGSRKGKFRTYLNIMVVFLASGLWHGANWTFVLWGALHGLANCLTRAGKTAWDKLHTVTRWALTFATANLLWVIFRADNVEHALRFIVHMVRMDETWLSTALLRQFDVVEFQFLEELLPPLANLAGKITGLHMALFLLFSFAVVLNGKNSSELGEELTLRRGLATVLLLAWSILSLSGLHTFLYFNF